MELKVGDIVKLKSGGPKMTVNRVGPIEPDKEKYETGLPAATVETSWFCEGEAGCYSATFDCAALVKVDP